MEGLGVGVGSDERPRVTTKLLIRENFVRKVVDHDETVEVCNRRFRTVLLSHESFPTLGVQGVSFGSGVPEVDSADCATCG